MCTQANAHDGLARCSKATAQQPSLFSSLGYIHKRLQTRRLPTHSCIVNVQLSYMNVLAVLSLTFILSFT